MGKGAALQEEIVKKLAAALEAEGLVASGTCISASDETNIDVSLANMRAYHPDTMAAVAQINTHAYWVRPMSLESDPFLGFCITLDFMSISS